MKLHYSEAFYSVQGEGKFLGVPAYSCVLLVVIPSHELWTR